MADEPSAPEAEAATEAAEDIIIAAAVASEAAQEIQEAIQSEETQRWIQVGIQLTAIQEELAVLRTELTSPNTSPTPEPEAETGAEAEAEIEVETPQPSRKPIRGRKPERRRLRF